MTSDEKAISAFLSEAWTSMATNQKPTSNASAWPAYTGPDTSLGINIVNSSLPGFVNYSQCAFWNYIADAQLATAISSTDGLGVNMTGTNSSDPSGGSSQSSAVGGSQFARLACSIFPKRFCRVV